MDSHLHAVSSVSTTHARAAQCARVSSETKMNPNSQTVTKRVAGRVSRPRQHYHRNYLLNTIITHIKRIRVSPYFEETLYLLTHRAARPCAAPCKLDTYLR